MLYNQVLKGLEEVEDNRNSDISLMIWIWRKYYNVDDSVSVNQLYDLPTQENIKRYRAKIQNDEKKFLPTSWEVAKARKWKEQEWRHLLGYKTAPITSLYVEEV